MPGFAASPMDVQFRDGLLSSLIARVPWLESQKARNRLRGELADSGGAMVSASAPAVVDCGSGGSRV
jgi:hypothetical protein